MLCSIVYATMLILSHIQLGIPIIAHERLSSIVTIQARIQLLTKGEVVKIVENNGFFCRRQQKSATACHENEFRNQLV